MRSKFPYQTFRDLTHKKKMETNSESTQQYVTVGRVVLRVKFLRMTMKSEPLVVNVGQNDGGQMDLLKLEGRVQCEKFFLFRCRCTLCNCFRVGDHKRLFWLFCSAVIWPPRRWGCIFQSFMGIEMYVRLWAGIRCHRLLWEIHFNYNLPLVAWQVASPGDNSITCIRCTQVR